MNFAATINTALGITTFNFDDSLSVLARTDYQRVLLLAQTIEKKEIGILAQLAACRGVLGKPKEGLKEAPAKPEDKPAEPKKPQPPAKGKKPAAGPAELAHNGPV